MNTSDPAAGMTLRELERADLPSINRWRNDPDLVELLGGSFRHVCLAVDERWYDNYLASRHNNVRLAICTAAGSIVGAVYLLDIDWLNRSAEFAIWIGEPSARGQGLGEAATRRALAHAFDDLNLERVHLSAVADNERALRLYRRLGFVQEGAQRRAVYKRGRYRDLVLMAILRDEYHTLGN